MATESVTNPTQTNGELDRIDQLTALLSKSAGIADLIGHTDDAIPGTL
ncbi:MAG: hypothetical protein JWL98_1273, partial [Xanthomonadaceae bacterium]|nr:hypothetical protein [Xanthomonadaceae bacterium]